MISPPAKPYAAFVSYSTRYRDWVATFHRHLAHCLRQAGETREVYRDETNLEVSRSWVSQLQAALAQTDHLVLIVTPEALASPRVSDEWQGFINLHRRWKSHLHLVFLVDTPLPPFLSEVQYIDFRDHDAPKYRTGLDKLVAALLTRPDRRAPPELPRKLDVPDPPAGLLPPPIRRQLVQWLASTLDLPHLCPAVAAALGVETAVLEGHASQSCAASAALVEATGDDEPVAAARRIVNALSQMFRQDRARVRPLSSLRDQLEKLHRGPGDGGLLGVWLASVEQDHATLVPYFDSVSELPLLDRVYVQLELRPGEIEPFAGEDPRSGLLQRLALCELLEIEPAEHPWVTRRWVVRGDPGAGKTTLLRHLALRLAGEPTPRWVPFYDSLPRLMRDREWLLDRQERQLLRAGERARGLASALDREGREGRLLLLLDGLDEVPRDYRDDADRLLRRLATRWPRTPIVVTTRPIGYRRPAQAFREIELLPLDRERQLEFLGRWFGRADGTLEQQRAADALRALEADASLRELAGNPLYLTLMALLLEEGHSPARHRPRLYDQVFELLMEGRHRPERKPMDCQEATRRVLRHLAHEMTRANRDAEPREALEARLYQPEVDPLREPLERVPRWRTGLRPFLEDLSERTGILGPHDGPQADWRFWHRTFREALAAEALEQRFREEGEAAVLEHARGIAGDESRWAEPYALLAGRVEEPDALVRALVRENRALGLRSLATAQGLEDETLREILELSDKWEERIKVYERIPELLEDPQRALALIDQLRQRTRNGNDLFFLEQAIGAVAKKWSDAGRLAQQLQSRFYDHIPAPPEDLFRWIETPLDGRVPLWREIPAGSFQMGSPPGEEGSLDRERPRHQVTVTSAFALAAVPVTNAQYAAFDSGREPYRWEGVPQDELRHHPVVGITWYEAMVFCRWLSTAWPWARGARLPTEEEWEYACRAGSETRYWSGDGEDDLDRVGWYDENSENRTHRVGEKPANPWGLYDVHGNVWEWTLRTSTSDYSGREAGIAVDPSAIDPADLAAPPGVRRVLRGGCCWGGALWARSAYRDWWDPVFEFRCQGFRVLLPVAPRFWIIDH